MIRLLPLLLIACVLDRTGQSATSRYDKDLAEHQSRIRDLESLGEDVGRRVAQLEEVTRARGQEDILEMETVEELRGEVAKMRGEFEILDHDYRTFETAQAELDKLAQMPDLTAPQKKALDEAIEQVKAAISAGASRLVSRK